MRSHPEVDTEVEKQGSNTENTQSENTGELNDQLGSGGASHIQSFGGTTLNNKSVTERGSENLNSDVIQNTVVKDQGRIAAPRDCMTNLEFSGRSLPNDPIHITDEGTDMASALSQSDFKMPRELLSYSNSGINTRLLFPDAAAILGTVPQKASDTLLPEVESFIQENSVTANTAIPQAKEEDNTLGKSQENVASFLCNVNSDAKPSDVDNKKDMGNMEGDSKTSLQVYRIILYGKRCFFFKDWGFH